MLHHSFKFGVSKMHCRYRLWLTRNPETWIQTLTLFQHGEQGRFSRTLFLFCKIRGLNNDIRVYSLTFLYFWFLMLSICRNFQVKIVIYLVAATTWKVHHYLPLFLLGNNHSKGFYWRTTLFHVTALSLNVIVTHS